MHIYEILFIIHTLMLLYSRLYMQSPGARFLFPEDWAEYEVFIPVDERGDYMVAYGRRLRGELGEEGQNYALYSMPLYIYMTDFI